MGEAQQSIPAILISSCCCLILLKRDLMPTHRMVNQLFFRSLGDLRKLDVAELLPFDNPRVVCMVSIASATFTAVDTVDAAIRAVLVGLQDEPKEASRNSF